MKAKHRHDLKTNALAEWIGNLPQWARENYRTIIYVSAVAVLVIGSASWYWYNKNVESVREQHRLTSLLAQLPQSKLQIVTARARGVDTSIMLIQIADNLQSAAQGAKNDQIAALALIKNAEARRTALHYRQGAVSRAELEAAINRAKAGYNEAFEKASPNPSLMATAKFGLGLCEEELGNFDEARQIYSDLSDLAANPDFEGTTALAQAKQRLKTMADYQQKVVFKASPKPKPGDFIQPPFELKPADTNLVPETPDILSEFPGIDLGAKMIISPFEPPDINLVSQPPNSTPETSDINVPGK